MCLQPKQTMRLPSLLEPHMSQSHRCASALDTACTGAGFRNRFEGFRLRGTEESSDVDREPRETDELVEKSVSFRLTLPLRMASNAALLSWPADADEFEPFLLGKSLRSIFLLIVYIVSQKQVSKDGRVLRYG